ncbi:Xylose isomerase-like TIM barrel [Planctomycetes bacterium Pan216]|uniref:Xylose isomerase-like TIM barrel n=1 Tax=Kolteria novifilia TaxID=2527975 RepID=A0A518B9S5_9BACT|nr:Xylose isomerase-like TIM barrel [Planctomycetes bacterium Pan216]
MSEKPKVILSGFADECAIGKTAVEQLAVFAALGLEYYSIRFVDVGSGIKNVMKLSDAEINKLLDLHQRYDMKVTSIGSPIGKVKLVDEDDGSSNVYVPFDKYLAEDVQHAIDLAHKFQTKLIRGFSFYPPRGKEFEPYFQQAIDQLGAIAQKCHENGVIYGLEIEANLLGNTGGNLARLYDNVNSAAMTLIFDGGNLSSQNLPAAACYEEYLKMRHGMGWMHVKDYRIDPDLTWEGHVDEERLKNFVPADEGDSGHEMIFRDFKDHIPGLTSRLSAMGVPGVFLDLEPHLKGGGQFGGFSGPDGMGVALRALCRLLDYTGIGYELRDFGGLKRG